MSEDTVLKLIVGTRVHIHHGLYAGRLGRVTQIPHPETDGDLIRVRIARIPEPVIIRDSDLTIIGGRK